MKYKFLVPSDGVKLIICTYTPDSLTEEYDVVGYSDVEYDAREGFEHRGCGRSILDGLVFDAYIRTKDGKLKQANRIL